MRIIKYELKKIVCSKAVAIAFLLLIIFDVCFLLFGTQTGYTATEPPFETFFNKKDTFETDNENEFEKLPYPTLKEQRDNGKYFAGEINDLWYKEQKKKLEDFINDPANQVSEEEKEKIKNEQLAMGLSEEDIKEAGNLLYLKEEIMKSYAFQKFERFEFAAGFYEKARALGEKTANNYREKYPGEKGKLFAEKTEEMYGKLADNYKAYYNYNLGYHKIRNTHSVYPFTVGLIILIGIAPIFSYEYQTKTDVLLLSSRHGKRKLIHAKISAALFFSFAVWAVFELINTAIVFSVYSAQGGESFWQNFMIDKSPFLLNQLQITLVTYATSLIGALFFASAIILISAISKNRFTSLISGGALLLVPSFDFAFTDSSIIQKIFDFFPTRMLTAINEWQKFDLFCIFGKALPAQYIIIASSILISLASILISFLKFKNKQAEN